MPGRMLVCRLLGVGLALKGVDARARTIRVTIAKGTGESIMNNAAGTTIFNVSGGCVAFFRSACA